MPLLKYFGFVGSGLLLLLFGLNWLLPQTTEWPVRSGVDKTVIRISSVERLPERVVIDTSLPTIVPPSAAEFSEQPPKSTLVEINPEPRQAIFNKDNSNSKKQRLAQREPIKKKAAAHRAPPAIHIEPGPYRSVQAAAPVTRTSLLDILKERLGQSFFKIN